MSYLSNSVLLTSLLAVACRSWETAGSSMTDASVTAIALNDILSMNVAVTNNLHRSCSLGRVLGYWRLKYLGGIPACCSISNINCRFCVFMFLCFSNSTSALHGINSADLAYHFRGVNSPFPFAQSLYFTPIPIPPSTVTPHYPATSIFSSPIPKPLTYLSIPSVPFLSSSYLWHYSAYPDPIWVWWLLLLILSGSAKWLLCLRLPKLRF